MRQGITAVAGKLVSPIATVLVVAFLVTVGVEKCWADEPNKSLTITLLKPDVIELPPPERVLLLKGGGLKDGIILTDARPFYIHFQVEGQPESRRQFQSQKDALSYRIMLDKTQKGELYL